MSENAPVALEQTPIADSMQSDRMQQMYNEIEEKRNKIAEIKDSVATPGFNASATDIISLKAAAKNEVPRIEAEIDDLSDQIRIDTETRQANHEVVDSEYIPTSDMDKELAYLEQEFNTVSSSEDITAALDLVSDFCDAHNLDRKAEKQLRARLMSLTTNTQEQQPASNKEDTSTEPVTTTDNTTESATTTDTKEETADSEEAKELAMGTRVQLTNEQGEHRIGIITEVKLDENHPTGVYYVIKPENGGVGEIINAHIEDLTVVEDLEAEEKENSTDTAAQSKSDTAPLLDGYEPVDEKLPVVYNDAANNKVTGTLIGSNADNSQYIIKTAEGEMIVLGVEAFEVVDSNDGGDDKTPPEEGSGTEQEEESVDEEHVEQQSDLEKLKAAPTAMYVALTAKLAESRKKWNELDPNKKKKYKWIGALAAVATGAIIVALAVKGHDTSSITDSSSVDTTASAGPDIVDSPNSGSAHSLTNAQQEFADSYANTPWQAAVDTYGTDQAAEALQSAVKKAQAAGENIKTFGEGSSWKIQANGTWNTQEVTKVLAEYMPKK